MVVWKPREESQWKIDEYIELGIQYRGKNRFRAMIRKKGVNTQKTFDTLAEARNWRAITLGDVLGEKFVDTSLADNTTLAEACQWALDRMGKPPCGFRSFRPPIPIIIRPLLPIVKAAF